MAISHGDIVSLAGFPGGDHPKKFRHSRHLDAYEGEQPGYPEFEFHVVEPLAWQDKADGRWVTRVRRRGEEEYLRAKLRRACGKDCPRTRRDEKTHRLAKTCDCPRQLHLSLESRTRRKGAPVPKTEEAYSRLCGWIKDGMQLPRRFPSEWWLRRTGPNRVVVHHERPPVEQDSEVAVSWVKDDSQFAGLHPVTPAEHEEWHAAMQASRGEDRAPAAQRAPAPKQRAQSAHERHIDALIGEGVPRGRPLKRRKRGGGK